MNIRLLIMTVLLFLLLSSCHTASRHPPTWHQTLRIEVQKLSSQFPGEFGLYVEDLNGQHAFSYQGDQMWYLSSTTKVPVAIALLQMVDANQINLLEKVTVQTEDYRDGAGPINWLKPRTQVTYRYLLQQMLIHSDNAATDLVIKRVGLQRVNQVVTDHAKPDSFGPITTLLDVRRKAYSEFHPKAKDLTNLQFLTIKKKQRDRLAELARQLKIPRSQFRFQDYSAGFAEYYKKPWNSATLTSYGELLRNLLRGRVLSEKSTGYLLKIMSRTQTGQSRIRKGLPSGVFFAHKTGTQHRQACDIGVAGAQQNRKPRVLILVCARHWKQLDQAEKLMAKVGHIIAQALPLSRPHSRTQ
jgi:beta-lactamase class A